MVHDRQLPRPPENVGLGSTFFVETPDAQRYINKKMVSTPEPIPGDIGFAKVQRESFKFYTGENPLVVTMKLSKNQWQVSFDQELSNQSAKMSGNWTSDLSDGKKLRAPITDEFKKGAFLLTMGRNSGIDNSYKEYLPNSSQIDRVTVQSNSKETSGNTSGF